MEYQNLAPSILLLSLAIASDSLASSSDMVLRFDSVALVGVKIPRGSSGSQIKPVSGRVPLTK